MLFTQYVSNRCTAQWSQQLCPLTQLRLQYGPHAAWHGMARLAKPHMWQHHIQCAVQYCGILQNQLGIGQSDSASSHTGGIPTLKVTLSVTARLRPCLWSVPAATTGEQCWPSLRQKPFLWQRQCMGQQAWLRLCHAWAYPPG